MKKTTLLSLLSALALTGCLTGCMSQLAKEIAKSDASVHLSVRTIYGTADFQRANPRPGQTATIAPDGTLTVKSDCD